MAADLWLFIPLAILSNTAFPLPFDSVLVWFAGGHSAGQAIVFAGLGSVCAGLAGLVDVALAGTVGRRLWSEAGRAGRAGGWFYLAVFLAAVLPIPFTTIRVMLLRVRPHPMLYAVVVSAGRLPRYLVTVRLWQSLAIPAWVGAALVFASAAWIMWQARHDRFTKLFFVRPAVHISTSAAMLNAIREARLRPEFASLYPDLAPGVWVPACTLRDFVLERGLYQRRTGLPSHRRLLLESHFEFRGGPLSRHHGWTGFHERTDEATA